MTPPTEPAADVIDFTVLSAAERDILTLLARGHTAKSIAALTGRSEASVNERLRQARRKTQLGSSRELARRFAAQENRDEKSDLDPPAAGGDALALSPIHAARPLQRHYSPYSPSDRRFFDPLYAAPALVLGEYGL